MSFFLTEATNNKQKDLQKIPHTKGKEVGDHTKINASDYQPKRFGLRYDPPMIVLEYLVPSTGKLYHHKMRLRNITPDSNTDEMADYLAKRHSTYFQANKIGKSQITDLVDRVKKRIAADMIKEESTTPNSPQSKSFGSDKKPAPKKQASTAWDFEEEEKEVDYNNYDLNKLDDYELQKHKDKMEEAFRKNQLEKGDKNFVYDKRVEFSKAKVDSGWDEDEDDEEFFNDF